MISRQFLSEKKKSDFKLHVYLEVEHLLFNVSYLTRPPIERHTYYFSHNKPISHYTATYGTTLYYMNIIDCPL